LIGEKLVDNTCIKTSIINKKEGVRVRSFKKQDCFLAIIMPEMDVKQGVDRQLVKKRKGVPEPSTMEEFHNAERQSIQSLSFHYKDLLPFVSPKTAEKLRNCLSHRISRSFTAAEQVQQPGSITGALLRDYQVKGVSINCHTLLHT
jgi:hypothetical protein